MTETPPTRPGLPPLWLALLPIVLTLRPAGAAAVLLRRFHPAHPVDPGAGHHRPSGRPARAGVDGHPRGGLPRHPRVHAVAVGADRGGHDHRGLDRVGDGADADLLRADAAEPADLPGRGDGAVCGRVAVPGHQLGNRGHRGRGADGHRRGFRHPGLLDGGGGRVGGVLRRQDLSAVGHDEPGAGGDGGEHLRSHPQHAAHDRARDADRAGHLFHRGDLADLSGRDQHGAHRRDHRHAGRAVHAGLGADDPGAGGDRSGRHAPPAAAVAVRGGAAGQDHRDLSAGRGAARRLHLCPVGYAIEERAWPTSTAC